MLLIDLMAHVYFSTQRILILTTVHFRFVAAAIKRNGKELLIADDDALVISQKLQTEAPPSIPQNKCLLAAQRGNTQLRRHTRLKDEGGEEGRK